MMSSSIMLIGCGPQAKYALETFSLLNLRVSRIFDPIGKKVGNHIGSHRIEAYESFQKISATIKKQELRVLLCLSDNRLKEKIFTELDGRAIFINAIHPGAHISKTAILGRCVIINAGAVIQPDVEIGNGCMIHAGGVVEHDNVIARFANLAPGVILAGGVQVGCRTTIYTRATVAPNVKIGKDVVIGAGSLVLNDVPDNSKAYGMPAKTILMNP